MTANKFWLVMKEIESARQNLLKNIFKIIYLEVVGEGSFSLAHEAIEKGNFISGALTFISKRASLIPGKPHWLIRETLMCKQGFS